MIDTRRRVAAVSLVLFLLSIAGAAEAAVNANWRELMGSASGGGVSQISGGSTYGTSVAPGLDGRPIVTYADLPDGAPVEEDARIVVKRWTGTVWQTLSPAGGVGSRGFDPQVKVARNGTIYVAWFGRDDFQVHLRRRTATGTVWEELSGSDGVGGLTRLNGSVPTKFSLAVAQDNSPIVAFGAPAQVGVPVGTEGILLDSTQIYVLQHMGAAGWRYLGSAPTEGGGASNIRSFFVDGGASYAAHSAGVAGGFDLSLAVDSAGRALVAFLYSTSYPTGPVPSGGATRSDVYVTRFEANSSTWTAVGPAVPQADDGGPGRGGPNGITTSFDFVTDLALAAAPVGDRLYLAWGEQAINVGRIYLRRWNGLDTWEELNGSATGNGLSSAPRSYFPSVAVDGNTNAIVAWLADVDFIQQIFVVRSNAFDQFEEMGPDSASNEGISGNAVVSSMSGPVVAHFDSGAPTPADNTVVAWTSFRSGQGPSQAFLRQFTDGASFPLNVAVSPPGAGRVLSNPIGIDCPGDTCSERFPSGQIVGLTPIAGPDFLFDKWFGACTGSGPCNVPMTANRSVNASFVGAASLTVATEGLGTVTGTGIKCGGPGGTDCSEKYRLGTVVTLSIVLPTGTLFDGWDGDCAFRGRNTSCALPMGANRSTVALFSQRVYRLDTVVTSPAGAVVNGLGGYLDGVALGGPIGDRPGFILCEHGAGVCSGTLYHGERVILSTVPFAGNKFLNYTGTVCGGRTNSTCEFTATGNTSITAFLRGVTALFAGKFGNGANKSVLKGPGLDCGLDCIGEAFTGTQVVISQTPGVGNRLLGFSGPPGCSGPTCSFLATGTNQSFDAGYQLNQYRLIVTGEGFGYTQSTDGGIDCGSVPGHSDCSQIYNHGDLVELVPYPGVDSRFLSWTGCSRLNGSTCLVDMLGNRAVFKRFGAARTLLLSGSGNGRGRYLVPGQAPLVCQGNCSSSYLLPFGQTVSVTPTPDTGSNFVWDTGPCAGRGGSCSYPMSTNQSGSGRYRLNRHRLIVTNRLNGSVVSQTPFPDASEIRCGSGDNVCTSEQDFGTLVHVRAFADEGNFFTKWSGNTPCSVGTRATNDSCSFLLQGNVTLTPEIRARTLVTIDKEGDGAGLVTGPGFNCGTDCTENIFDSKRITLLATAALGSRFNGFSGACFSNASNSCNFLPTGNNQTVFATFSLLPFTFSVTSRNQGVVTSTSPLADPIECGAGNADCSSTLLFGTDVVLVADPIDGFAFVNWAGDPVCAGKTNSTCSFKVPARNNFVITPNYRPRTFLSVFKTGNGEGLVTGPNINCGLDCAEPIVDGKAVTLIAKAAVGSIFQGFGSPCLGNSSTCTFTPAGENQSVSAAFALLPFTLSVASRNQGVVSSLPVPDTIQCGSGFTDCAETALFGTVFVLRADPNDGFVFDKWGAGGPCAGSTNRTCTHRLVANTLATPLYRARTLVNVVKDGNGAGTVTGVGFNCGTDCSEAVFDGKAVTLTAAAAVGSIFDGFDGACVSNTSTCTFIPTGNNQTVFATFVLRQFILNVTSRANGSVDGTIPAGPIIICGSEGDSCTAVVDFGVPVTLVATPVIGNRFINWTGDAVCAGKTNRTCLFPMPTRNVTVTPNYQRATLVEVLPDGQGTVTGTGLNCVSTLSGFTGDCSETVVDNRALTVTATPATGWDFGFWDDGNCNSSPGNVCTFTPAGQSTVVYPVFFREMRIATVNVVGNGSVVSGFEMCDPASTPCDITRFFGDQIILTASPFPGNQFTSWTGCTSVNGSICTLLLNTATNRTVTVTFQPVVAATISVGGATGFTTFSLPTVTINAGETVRWTWASSPHNVVSGPITGPTAGTADNQFCSPTDTNCASALLTGPGTVYTHTFNTPGTFTYFCRQHRLSNPAMTGTVIVAGPE